VNGHPLFVGELSAAVLPADFTISIQNMGTYDQATVINEGGPLTELVIGGQEFTIDNICPMFLENVEEPGDNAYAASLGLNYPNPFTGHTAIPFDVKESTHVVVTIYDHLGKQIAVLADAEYKIGVYTVNWDAGNVSNGIYFYQLRTGVDTQSRIMIVE